MNGMLFITGYPKENKSNSDGDDTTHYQRHNITTIIINGKSHRQEHKAAQDHE